MNCKQASGMISDYVDGSVFGREKSELEAHLQSCYACASELEETRGMVAALSGLGELKSPVDCWPGVRERIRPLERRSVPWWRWVLKPVVAAPAAAAVGLLALALMWPMGQQPLASDDAFAPEYSYYIAAHSHLQRGQTFADPDAVFVKAEMQKASLVSEAGDQ